MTKPERIIETIDANCQDCYRCVRVCPIGAIRVEGGQARVDATLCIACGTCVRECPQGAKVIHRSLASVRAWAEAGETLVASVAPSFAAAYPAWRAARIPAALRLLGFMAAGETAEGANAVAQASRGAEGSITTCCPAVVRYIEKYRPKLLLQLMPLASPMVAHGRMLKARYGDAAKVVFIGPCAAKKGEGMRAAEAIDAVLTFDELNEWMEDAGIDLRRCPESGFDTYGEIGSARLFPLEGGQLKAAGIEADAADPRILRTSGAQNVIEVLDTAPEEWPYDLAELTFCRGGCVGGPCMPQGSEVFAATRSMVAYAQRATALPGEVERVPLDTIHTAQPVAGHLRDVGEMEIRQILEKTGKAEEQAQLNCGACGYPNCRDMAIAVARGMAEPNMCVSYVRKKAERRADQIIENSPNGIVTVDLNLNIVHMNARFSRMFGAASLIGQPVSRVVDPDGFEQLLAGAEGTREAIRTRDGMKYQELIFSLPGEKEMTGIYVDVSQSTFDAKQVDLIKDQSLKHARDLLAHQIRFSQEMAHYLGKSTAQTEELVKRLLDMYAEDGAP